MEGTATIRLDGRVAIVTGSGRGLGREYALALAERGARVIVNGTGSQGDGAEEAVVAEIKAAGGQAVAVIGSVTDRARVEEMAETARQLWGRVDILVCNAGFVRDRTFAKVDMADFQAVLDVHLHGALNCLKAVWPGMIEQQYGRVVLIGSTTGLAGNFGQSAYGTAKMALVGLMNTLGLEGGPKNVRVNCFSPAGASRMNEELLTGRQREIFAAAKLRAGIVFLASEQAPNRAILLGGGGSFERAYVTFSRGLMLENGAPEELADRWDDVSDRTGDFVPESVMAQLTNELANIAPKDEN